MSIEAMKLALEALEGINDADRDKDFLDLKQFVRLDIAIEALRDAIQQAEAQQPATGEPVAALVRSRRIRTPAHCAFDKKDHYSEWSDWEPCTLSYARAVTDPARDRGLLPLYEMLPLYTHPAPSVPEFSRIAKRKLDELQKQGFTITGYAIQCGTHRGFITNGGFVGWWRSDEAPSVPDAAIDSAIYNQCPDFDDWHEGPSIDDIRAIVRAAMLAAKEAK